MYPIKKPEITTDGRTVWVNAPICIGRFGPVGGEVMDYLPGIGYDGCECVQPNWAVWCKRMHEVHEIVIPEDMRPTWVPNPDG